MILSRREERSKRCTCVLDRGMVTTDLKPLFQGPIWLLHSRCRVSTSHKCRDIQCVLRAFLVGLIRLAVSSLVHCKARWVEDEDSEEKNVKRTRVVALCKLVLKQGSKRSIGPQQYSR